MAGGIKGITVKIGGDTTELGRALSDATTKSTSLQRELRGVNTLLKMDPGNVTLLTQKSDLLKQSITETENKLKSLNEVLQKVESGEIEMTDEEMRNLEREIASTENQLKGLKNQFSEFGSVGAQKVALVGEKFKDVGGKVEDVGKKLSVVSAAAGAILGGSITLASNFADAMAQVNTIADTSEVSLSDLSDQILELSNTTGIAATDIAAATYNAISAGQDTADAVSFVSNATSLARAGFTDTGSAIDVLTTIMNAYGMEAEEVGRVSDILIMTQNKGKTTVAELASTMGKVIPTANSMNVSLDQLAASYAIMTANGVATAESTTYMNGMLNELGKSSTTVGKILQEKTGKSFQQLMADGLSLGDVLKVVQDYSNESGIAFNELWSSAEAGRAALILAGQGVEGFNEMVDTMNESVGATSEALEKLETPSHTAEVAINQVKNAGIELGTTALEALAPLIEKVATAISNLTSWFSNLSPEIQQTILVVLGIVTALGPFLIILGKIISSIGSILTLAPKLVAGFNTMKTAFTALSAVFAANPIGLVITALAALVAAFIYAYNHSEKFRDIVNNAFNKVKEVVGNVVNALVTFFTQTLPNAFNSLVNKVKEVVNNIVNCFKNLPSTMVSIGKNIIQGIINGIGSMVSSLYSSIKNALSGLVQRAKSALGIASPSKVFANVIGKQIPAGIAQGVEDNQDIAEDAVERMADDLTDLDLNDATLSRKLNATFTASAAGSNAQVAEILGNIYNKLDKLRIYLDSGELVGGLIDSIDGGLNEKYTQTERGW